jgi:uncharacterized membrane protein AbrB (regulator of aidB expression)
MLQNVIIIVWILSAIYCLYKLFKRSKMSSYDGVIGYSPGLEVIMVVMIGPLLAIIDISLTWIRIYKEAEEARRRAENKGV